MASKDLGKVAVRPMGTWDDNTLYSPFDFVYNPSDGSGYLAKVANTGIRPDTDPSVWSLSLKAGASGKAAIKPILSHSSSDVAVAALAWDTVHIFPEMSSLSFTLGNIPSDGSEHQVVIIFDTPSDLTDFSLVPDGSILWANGIILADNIAPSTRYEININSTGMVAVYAEAPLPATTEEEESEG
ncbi:MAG: hypothetical protein IJK48_09200 [Bacteroidales bacterium]|nr:hypothetical protein [Bacteroidales bacterium]